MSELEIIDLDSDSEEQSSKVEVAAPPESTKMPTENGNGSLEEQESDDADAGIEGKKVLDKEKKEVSGVLVSEVEDAELQAAEERPMANNPSAEDIECIDITDDIEAFIAAPCVIMNPIERAQEDIRNKLEDFIYSLKNLMTPKEKLKVKNQIWARFEKIKFDSMETATNINVQLDEVIKRRQERPKKIWTTLQSLLNFMTTQQPGASKKVKRKKDDETEEERTERKKKERILELEKHLKKMEAEIQKYSLAETNFDDEGDSSYIRRDRCIKRYMETYKILCRITGCNSYTGRPIEKRLKLDGISRCPEIDEAVEKFMNSQNILFIPDFHDIKKVISDYNSKACPPPLCDSDIDSTAKELFREVLRITRNRRRQDFEIAVPLETTLDDPADKDEELRKKLDENEKLKKTEQEVFDIFARQQDENKEVAKEVEEDPASSAGESDDEEEDDDSDVEKDQESAADAEVFTKDQVEDESSEDDDEVVKEEKVVEEENCLSEKTSTNGSCTVKSEDDSSKAASDEPPLKKSRSDS